MHAHRTWERRCTTYDEDTLLSTTVKVKIQGLNISTQINYKYGL